MKCPRCKKQLRKGAKFCPACGAKIEKRRVRPSLIVWILIMLLSLIVIGWSGGILFAKHFGGNFKDLFLGKKTVEIHSVEEAIAHAKEFGEELGYENAFSELTEKVTTTIDGDNYYRLQQNYQGIPVYGRSVVYTTDQNSNCTSITGNIIDIENDTPLIPTVTIEQLEASINAYLSEEFNHKITDTIEIKQLGQENLCIYSMSAPYKSDLAYRVEFANYVFLVSAIDGNVYEAVPNTQNVVAYSADDVNQAFGYYVELTEDGLYAMKNSNWGISVYDLKGKSHKEEGSQANSVLVTSEDDIFGNNNEEDGYDRALKLYSNITDISHYFNQSCGFDYGGLFIFINDGKDWGCNASGGIYAWDTATGEYYGQIDIGKYIDYDDIDVLSHEFGHLMSYKIVSWAGGNGESGAINEGLSDIFGELYEGSVYGNPDWYMEVDYWAENIIAEHGLQLLWADPRNIADPIACGYPASTQDYSSKNDSHINSTIISHAAYLMWNGINGNTAKKISANDLLTLWYRTMMLMPSDCDFNECRELVELAATTMTLTTAQRACVAEAFDNVGIAGTSQSNDSKIIIFTASGETAVKGTVYEVKTENGIETIVPVSKATMTVYSGNSTKAHKKLNVKNENGFFEIELPAGTYSVAITADGYVGQTISFELTDNEVRYFSVELEPADNKTENNMDAYSAYLNATRKITESGSWSERLTMTADMAITDGNAKTKTKVTLTSDANVSNYSENDLSQIRMSGSAEMTVMGQTYAWDMEYENGTAHYRYTKPNQTSADMKIDPSFFNFGTMTSDMMTDAKLSGNKITFTVPGDKIAEVGIAAVNQMSGVGNLKYGDVDVTVTISNEGKIDNIIMVFHASLEYQGYDADVDYNIDYRFSDSSEKSDKPASNDRSSLQEYIDFSKSWGIRKDVSTDPSLYMEQVYDFAFMEDGTFYCYFYQQYTDFIYGFHGTYLFEDHQIKFYFDNDDGTSTLYAYSFNPDAMQLIQVSEKGIWNASVGTEYSLKNDEWFPSAKDVIDSAKRAIENRGVEMGG